MRAKDVAQFACELKEALEEHGALALERINWADRFWEFGFHMDAGDSLERHYGLSLHDARGLRRERDKMRHRYSCLYRKYGLKGKRERKG